MYKVAIVGSRKFRDYRLMKEILDSQVDKISLIISGGAIGADTLAQRFAKENGIPIQIYYPRYKEFGKKAPLVRNVLIAQLCEKMIAFAYPDSRGTQHVINKARQFNKDVVVIEVKEEQKVKEGWCPKCKAHIHVCDCEKIMNDMIEVCEKCFRASCWQGILYCDDAKSAGTIFMKRETLLEMAYEHSDYWE